MKSKIYVLMVAICCIGLVNGVQAQLKIAYADVDYVFSKLPDAKQIESSLKAHSAQLENTLKTKYEEYQKKGEAYQNLPADTPEAIQRDKLAELGQLEQNIQQFQQEAQASLEKKRRDLMEPVYTRVGNAIKAVAEEGGYDFILTAGVGGADIILYAKEDKDVSEKVLEKMGVAATTK